MAVFYMTAILYSRNLSSDLSILYTDTTLPHRCQSSQRSKESMCALINNPSFMCSLKPMNVQPWVSPPKIPPTKTTIINEKYSLAILTGSYAERREDKYPKATAFFTSDENLEIMTSFYLNICNSWSVVTHQLFWNL